MTLPDQPLSRRATIGAALVDADLLAFIRG